MRCPFCGAEDTSVVDSRISEEGARIRRRRRCVECEKRFTTYETVELRFPQVIKQDGNRVEFNREKLYTSFARALHKRPVPTGQVDAAIERILQKLLGSGVQEISSRTIGEWVMQSFAAWIKWLTYVLLCIQKFEDVGDFHGSHQEVRSSPQNSDGPSS
ncbi:MAG: transcriptional regulator NrdR [Nitrosomonas sp.]|nr:transcriptional regulator NrdR [Nitrosomonas sp.]